MDNNGQQWITMYNNGQHRTTMDNTGQQWITMENNGQCPLIHSNSFPKRRQDRLNSAQRLTRFESVIKILRREHMQQLSGTVESVIRGLSSPPAVLYAFAPPLYTFSLWSWCIKIRWDY